ncbi:MAG: glutathione S-transferase N-terminal domain-containing protein [Parvularculaceae bacterium]
MTNLRNCRCWRRIPVLVDDGLVVNDSSVIAQYLEEKHPFPTIFPATAAARARARWFEEYADTRMGDVFIWKVFGRMAILAFFGTERDLEKRTGKFWTRKLSR